MTKRLVFGGIAILVLLALAVVGYVLRPSELASGPIEAVPITDSLEESPETSAVEDPTDVSSPTEVIPIEEPATEGLVSDQESGGSAGSVIFQIVQDESLVRFSVNEVLRGNPATAVGTTDQVAGEIAVDFENPANSQLGVILVNARTLTTDNDFRNRAINNEILDTGAFEFITFTPTSVTGFPESVSIGESIPLQITGDLTIRDITNEVTFEAKVTPVSESRLEGTALAIVSREAYNLIIPNVRQVAGVEDEVLLDVEFVATTG